MSSEKTMEYNFLGNSGLKVSNLCLGTMTFGTVKDGPMAFFFNNPTQLEEDAAHKILDRYTELGGNFIDTANIYAGGNSEKIIGTWLNKKKRDDVIVATKVRFPIDWTSKNAVGLSRRHILKSCEDSLARLQTDYIDLYQAHMWDNGTPIEETLRAFNDLVRCGKIRYYGFSNVCGWQMQKIVETTRRLNLEPCISLQALPGFLPVLTSVHCKRLTAFPHETAVGDVDQLLEICQQYSLLRRHSEWEEFMVCENEGIGVLPWSPLKGGMLTGKFKKGEAPDTKGSRTGHMVAMKVAGKTSQSSWDELCNDEQYWNLIDVMNKVAKDHGKSVPQVALRWLLQRKVVSSVIIGATSIKQLEDNIGASAGWKITDDEMKALTEASPRANPYPYDMIWGMGQSDRNNPFKR